MIQQILDIVKSEGDWGISMVDLQNRIGDAAEGTHSLATPDGEVFGMFQSKEFREAMNHLLATDGVNWKEGYGELYFCAESRHNSDICRRYGMTFVPLVLKAKNK